VGFWAKLSFGLALVGQVLVAALSLEVVGGEVTLPSARLEVKGREFAIRTNIKRLV